MTLLYQAISFFSTFLALSFAYLLFVKKKEKVEPKKEIESFKISPMEHQLVEETVDKDGKKGFKCSCGWILPTKHMFNLHIESLRTSNQVLDETGWPKIQFTTVPFVSKCQKGVISKGLSNGTFTEIHLVDQYDGNQVKDFLSQYLDIVEKVKEIDKKSNIVSTIAIGYNTWIHFDSSPPQEFFDFEEKKPKGKDTIAFPKTGGDIFIMTKSNRLDLCYEISKNSIQSLGKNLKTSNVTCGFAYMPVPMAAKDLTGFIDGTRNPDHLLRAIVDEVLIFPEDEGNDQHVGGTYLYAGKFIHDLKKFNTFSNEEKSNLVGRDITTVKPHVGYDTRPENPQLKNPHHTSHTQRGYGSMYRHAMPFREETEEGLYFVSVSRSLDELDTAINRMAGQYNEKGELDGLFKFTKAKTSNYYYVPSLDELKKLKYEKFIENPKIEQRKKKRDGKVKIFIEYCTNCGYKTLYLEHQKLLESLSDEITVIGNPVFPRLSAYEVSIENGPLLWSKLSQPNGKNNYPEVFPKSEILVKGIKEFMFEKHKIEIKEINLPETKIEKHTRVGIW